MIVFKPAAGAAFLFVSRIETAISFSRPSTISPYSTRAYLKLRGGSDADAQDDDAIVSTIETSVIENSPPVDVSVPEPADITPPVASSLPPAATAPPAEKKVKNAKLGNAIERTGPALLMLGAIFLLIKVTGENGLLYGLIPLMQLGMYFESTEVIEAFKKDVELKFEKWWWFATVFASTTLRSLGGVGKLTGSAMDLACFGMMSFGLVMAVVGMASHQAAGPDMFRKYLGEVAAFHFALVSS